MRLRLAIVLCASVLMMSNSCWSKEAKTADTSKTDASEKTSSEERVAQLESERDALQVRVDELEKKAAKHKKSVDHYEKELKRYEADIKDYEKKIKVGFNDYLLLSREKDAQEKTLKECQTTAGEEATKNVENLQTQLRETQEKLERLKTSGSDDVVALRETVDNARAAHEQCELKFEDLLEKAKKTSASCNQIYGDYHQMDVNMQTAIAREESCKLNVEKLRDQVAKLGNDVADVASRLSGSRKELDACKETSSDLKKDLRRKHELLNVCEDERTTIVYEFEEQKYALQKGHKRHQEVLDEKDEISEQLQDAKNDITAYVRYLRVSLGIIAFFISTKLFAFVWRYVGRKFEEDIAKEREVKLAKSKKRQ